jgi:Na+/proline symporter
MGWGLGYFGQPHILARFMAADSHTPSFMPVISMTWMILCLAGACGRLLRYRLLQQQPGAGGRGEPERRARVHRAGANSV